MTALPVVLIIGASRGLGLALAREWLSRGWTVIATARSAGQAAGLQETAATSDGRLTIEQLEMTDVAAVKALREGFRAVNWISFSSMPASRTARATVGIRFRRRSSAASW